MIEKTQLIEQVAEALRQLRRTYMSQLIITKILVNENNNSLCLHVVDGNSIKVFDLLLKDADKHDNEN